MSSTFTNRARSSLAFGDASCRSEFTPSGALAATTSLISMPASSNTNSNANNDVVEIIGRLSGSDPLLNRSPLSSGQSTPCSSCSSPEQDAEMQVESPSPLNIALPNATSPIAGDLPAKYAIPTATSPSLGFQMPANEHDRHSSVPHSPNIPTTAAQFLQNSTIEMLTVTRASISPTATLSPTGISASSPLFQQNMILDPLSLPSGVLLPPTLEAVAMSHENRQKDEEDDEPQMCLWDNCGKEFPSLSSLVSHLDRGHTLSMVKYICFWKDCPRNLKPFDARYKLITHLRCHTGEKPYSCGVVDCRRSFSRLENLKLHVRTHTGEKPYVCHYESCDKRFNNTSDRAKHMKTHITRKPYACKFPGCGKSYTDPSSMRKHVKYTHKLREKQMLEEEGAGVIRIHRSPRKSSSASRSSTSSTPQSSPGIVIYPTPSSPISALVNVTSPVGTTFPSNAKILQTVQSPPPPSSTNTINHQSSNLTVAGVTAALTNPNPAPLVSMPFFQLPGQNTTQLASIPQGVQGARPLLSTQQQPIVMFLPAANSISPQGIVAAQQEIPTQPVAVTSNGLTWPSELQSQGQGIGREKESGESTDPTAVEKHLRMQIALLQQQLANSQQQKIDESNLRGASPSKVSTVTTTAAVQQPPVVRILQPAPNNLSQSLTQMQLPTIQTPFATINNAVPTQLPQYIPISNLAAAHQLRTLNIATTTATSNSKPLTVLNSAPILGLPPTSGQTRLPQFVVPGTQVIPIFQSPGVTPQIMYVTPNPQPLNGKT